jgi:hypothetical protein
VILAPFGLEAVLKKLRPAFQSAPIRSLLAPGACDPRALHLPRFLRFEVANRGLYDVAELRDRHLAEELRTIAETVSGARLQRVRVLRIFRFRRGGYSLLYDDALSRIDSGVEVTLDLSHSIIGAPVIYQSGDRKLVVPQVPGLVAIVERTPDTYRYDRYVPASAGRAEVRRLRAAFPYAD